MRRSLTARGGDTAAAEVAAYWPGGAQNPEKGRGGWIFCYANLVGMLRVADLGEGASDSQGDAAVARALAAEPQTVTLCSGEAVQVYPKSYHALRWLDTLDRAVRDWTALAGSLHPDAPDELKLLALAPLAESLAVRVWAWILTAGSPASPAALPFDEAVTSDPPAWTTQLTPEDLLTIARAHANVNGHRLRIIAQAFPSDTKAPSRLNLSGFLGTAAQELGQRPFDVFRHWSLGEAFAQAATAAQASREARERAESAPRRSH